MSVLDKTFRPAEVERRHYDRWEQVGAFACGRAADGDPYTIVIPPPNVTGSLHMGHALNNTLQDILIRFERMRGRDALWQPGTDHAGIATQMVVERQLADEGNKGRRELGREAFIERVWDWKAESGGTITRQLRRLGASCDWSRERFTMDEGLSRAVLKVFVQLYREGLIYRDKRLVNWDPKLETAISDLEVEQRETNGHLWYFKYPVEGETDMFLTVATTRPETMLGDTAVAVHPDDDRYRHLVGRHCILPLVGRRIPIVADEYADPEQGSGAVKITPAHDFNDFEVGRRHDLEMINVFDRHARITFRGNTAFLQGLPNDFKDLVKTLRTLDGLDRYEARERIVAMMEQRDLLERAEPHVYVVPYSDRGGTPIEPLLTIQWYVDAAALAKPAIEAVEAGRTRFFPEHWARTYFEWMRNIQPWCISRQLWWGHQIPVWYGRKVTKTSGGEPVAWASIEDDPEIFVAASEAEAMELAQEKYGCEMRPLPQPPRNDLDPIFQQVIDDNVKGEPRWEPIWRDEDVLDTWFSSALWPFSTLGWPDETPELARHYPTDVLVTGFDIIFFWVARMMMMGLHFMDEAPFRTVYVHALVRDARGQKMSKSKGNVIDPLELIDRYGADALRFTLASLAAPGRDVRLSESRVEGGRNFATKIWNAARFCQMNGCAPRDGFDPASAEQTINRWIVNAVADCESTVTERIEGYRFNEAAQALYHFVWGAFCDWYLEFSKPLLEGMDDAVRAETRDTAGWAFDQILRLLHPFMPFVTEELWGAMSATRAGMLILAPWPVYGDDLRDPAAAEEMDWVIRLIAGIRSVRAEMNVPPGARVPMALVGAADRAKGWLAAHEEIIRRLARLSEVTVSDAVPEGSVQLVHDDATVALPLAGVIDVDQERQRLEKERTKVEKDIGGAERKLANEQYLSKAPAAVVEAEREKLADFKATHDRIVDAIDRLSGLA